MLKAAASSTSAPSSDANNTLSSIGVSADSEALHLAIEVVGASGQGHLSNDFDEEWNYDGDWVWEIREKQQNFFAKVENDEL